jgi:hypothetical protein
LMSCPNLWVIKIQVVCIISPRSCQAFWPYCKHLWFGYPCINPKSLYLYPLIAQYMIGCLITKRKQHLWSWRAT